MAEELNRLDAGIDLFGGHRALIRGPRRLQGTIVQAPDLRGGAALVMAGLVSEGTTVVDGATHCAATKTSKTSSPPWARPSPSRPKLRSPAETNRETS